MRLTYPSQPARYPNIWITLEKIQHAMDWSTQELVDRLGLTQKQYELCRKTNTSPSVHAIAQLIENIGLSIETIITGNIDYEALKAHASGNLFYIPQRYIHAAFSKRRTSINLLDFLETYFGWQMKKNILNHFQMKEAAFQDPDSNMSFLFPADLCEFLAKSGYSTNIFHLMGAHSVVTNKNSNLGKMMTSFGGPKQLHERVFADVVGKFFDKNCEYRLIRVNQSECLIEARFTKEIQDLLKTKKLGNTHACAIRGGSFASLTGYLNLPFSTVTEEKCIHRGDDCCTYKISYQFAQQLSDASLIVGNKFTPESKYDN